jgi:dienelactone hydrolase
MTSVIHSTPDSQKRAGRRAGRARAIGLVLAASGLAAAIPASARIVEEVLKVPVEVKDIHGKVIAQDIVLTLFRDTRSPQPQPVVVLNHGRSPVAKDRAALGRVRFTDNAEWFAHLGFLVAVPTRIGYGETGGEDVEGSGSCTRRDFAPVFEAAAQQTRALLEVVRQRSDVDPKRTVLVGQSFGGATTVALAAMNLPGVQAAVNFAGGGGGNPKEHPREPCSQPQLKQLFADYGQAARIPMLWVYTENDQYFGPDLPKEWHRAFVDQGGSAEFVQFPPHGRDGHGLFTRGPEVWRPAVLSFLRTHGYPALVEP